MGLLECNEDVVRLMLRYLGRADLCSVCLVHPGLRALGEPLLYSDITIGFYGGRPRPITLLLRSILRRPELVVYIRTLFCYDSFMPPQNREGKLLPMPMPEVDLQPAVSFVEETCLPFRDQWIKELREGTPDAYLAFLLARLPHLQRLCLLSPFSVKLSLVGLVVRSILCGPRSDWLTADISTSLSKLRIVSIFQSGNPPTRNTESALPFFYLPAVESLHISIDQPLVSLLPWPTTQPPSAFTLTSLSVSGKMRESYLGQLLAAVPRLRTLQWEWRCEKNREGQFNSPVVNLDQLMPALAEVNETLTELRLAGVSLIGTPLRLQGSARALAGFDRLTKLLIPVGFLTGFSLPVRESIGNCLPRNLEKLTLTDDLSWDEECDEVYGRAIVTWLANVRTSAPRLRELCLLFDDSDIEIFMAEILELVRQAGIVMCEDSRPGC